jgi:phosphohistidine phosphatase SixA
MAPGSVFLMRHAEKPDDPKDPDLALAGVERAERLANWLPSIMGGPPQFIFAASLSKRSARPYETVKPLSKAVGVPINATFADQDYSALAEELLVDPVYANAVVVVCWHHGHIPSFARDLKAPAGTYPDPWPDGLFNLVLKFDFGTGSVPTVTQITEDF